MELDQRFILNGRGIVDLTEGDGFILFPFECFGTDVDAVDDVIDVVPVTVDGVGVCFMVGAEIIYLEHATVAVVAVGIVSTAVEPVGDAIVADVNVVFSDDSFAFDVLSVDGEACKAVDNVDAVSGKR